jgi:hypothetical protein
MEYSFVLQADRKYLQILVLKSINSGLFFDNFSTFFNLSFEFKSAYHCSCTDKCYDIDYEYDITMGRYFTINKASVDTNRILLNFGKYTTLR